MDDEKRRKEMLKRLGLMEDLVGSGRKSGGGCASRAKPAPTDMEKKYDVGSAAHSMVKRLSKMEELEKQGGVEKHKQAKKDIWKRLAEQAQNRKD
jgi:hypothetical protein